MSFDRSKGVRDPRFLRAMAHPLRMKLDQLLSVHGPMTATQLSERVDESPANCSYHLRTMARWGFIEEVPGGKGRERLWGPTTGGWGVDPEDLSAEGKAAHRALRAVQRQHLAWQEQQWEDRKADFPEAWRHHAFTSDWEGSLSVDQLVEISDGFAAVLARVQGQEKPADAVRVHLHINAIPIGDPPPQPDAEPPDPGQPAERPDAGQPDPGQPDAGQPDEPVPDEPAPDGPAPSGRGRRRTTRRKP